jgi:hypothetical protein
VYSIDTDKMATLNYLPWLQDVNNITIISIYVLYSE